MEPTKKRRSRPSKNPLSEQFRVEIYKRAEQLGLVVDVIDKRSDGYYFRFSQHPGGLKYFATMEQSVLALEPILRKIDRGFKITEVIPVDSKKRIRVRIKMPKKWRS